MSRDDDDGGRRWWKGTMRWKPEDSKMKESREQLNLMCRSDQQKNQPAQKCANKELRTVLL